MSGKVNFLADIFAFWRRAVNYKPPIVVGFQRTLIFAIVSYLLGYLMLAAKDEDFDRPRLVQPTPWQSEQVAQSRRQSDE